MATETRSETGGLVIRRVVAMPSVQRVPLRLAILFAALAVMTLVIVLVDGSTWYRWLLVVTTAGTALLQAREFNRARKTGAGPPTR